MNRGITILLVLSTIVVGQALTPNSYFTPADVDRLRAVFAESRPYGDDLQALHYSVLGYTLLGDKLETPEKTCESLKKSVDANDVESVYYATSAIANLKAAKATCQWSAANVESVLNAALTDDASPRKVYHAVASLSNLGLKVDTKRVSTILKDAIKTEDTPLRYAYTFLAASFLPATELGDFHSMIEDVIAQADEVQDTYLQYEGGLLTTALVIDASYKLAEAAKKPPTLTEAQVLKFSAYFLGRKHVHVLKNAVAVLSVMKTLTTNTFHVPVAVTLASQVSIADSNTPVKVRVTNLLGSTLGKLTVTAETARHVGDDAVVLSKKAFTVDAKDSSLYQLDLMSVKPAKGFYKISINVAPTQADKRLIGTTGAEIEVKVTTQVAIENVDIGVADREQSTVAKTIKLQYPNKAVTVLEVDHQQRVVMKFVLKDKQTQQTMTAHQAFVKMTHLQSQQEIIFVAEPDSKDDVYTFNLDIGASAKDFAYVSGKYNLELIVGDAVIQNPFAWSVADVDISFQEAPSGESVGFTQHAASSLYKAKPEIQHQFQQPEPRPSSLISTMFTVLCLIPVLLLFILWAKLGVNISAFPMSISAIGFHLGLGGIFALYYCYFLTLTMFETLRWLAILGVPTFLFGNRLLSSIAARRKA